MQKNLPDDKAIDVILRRSTRARRFSLRVSRLDGRVTLTLPMRAREAEAMAFLRDQEDWVRRQLANVTVGQSVTIGSLLPVEGQMMNLVSGPGRQVRVEGDRLLVPGDPAQAGARVGAWLRVMARERLAQASDHYAGLLGQGYSSLALRDTRSRWGSCSTDGRLMYSWRLILGPPDVLRYVAAHEVAHLAEMNHSDAFWAVVERLYPGYAVQRRWLKTRGQGLHSYRFGA